MNHPYSGGDKSSTSIDPTTKPKRGKKKSKPESIETIDQFQTQTQEESSGRSKRKYLDMAIESEEDEDYSIQPVNRSVGYSGIGPKDKYVIRPAGYSWEDFRKTHGQGTVRGSESDDAKAASRALEDIKSFAVSVPFHLGSHVKRDIRGIRLIVQERTPDSWLPLEKWDPVSPECESRNTPRDPIKRPVAVSHLLVFESVFPYRSSYRFALYPLPCTYRSMFFPLPFLHFFPHHICLAPS